MKKTIAVIGASRDRNKFGNKCVRAYLEAGYEVFPVNLHETEIEGLPTVPFLRLLPRKPDRISIYLPPEKTATLLSELTSYPESEIWFNPGSANAVTLAEAERLGLRFEPGCSIVDVGLSPGQFP